MEKCVVIKQNTAGEETWRYDGMVVERDEKALLIEAFFNRSDLPFHGIVLKEGDRFVEAYFRERWFNIFQIYDRDDQSLKCWYCNVTRPAQFVDGRIEYVDLALDLLVFPDGTRMVLDEDEFSALNLDVETRQQARSALQELWDIFADAQQFRIEKEYASLAAGIF